MALKERVPQETTIRVILADDHPTVRASVRKLLEAAPDIKVIGEASDGLQALHLTQQLNPEVLLLDMEMPLMDGVEVTRRLQAADSTTHILALSAYDDWSYIKGLLDTGAAGYLTKAEAPEILVEVVREVAQGEQGRFSRRIAKQIAARGHTADKGETGTV